ncbi:GGDEF domain-containing protein [Marinobacteraceae bacterium S3BR75-40.1]
MLPIEMLRDTLFYRLRTDFRLSIMTMLCTCAVLGITPFAVFRFLQGNVMAGVVDLMILGSIFLLVAYAWWSGDTRRSGLGLAISTCTGGVAVATIMGDVAVFWLFPAFVTSFFLTTPLWAVIVNAAAMLFLVVDNVAFDSTQQMFSFLATGLVVSACAYIFALRNESQRQQLEELATQDPLTGAKNRRAMERELEIAEATAMHTGVQHAIVMIDLDNFKAVNDSYGHTVGDGVLVRCADLIRDNTRQIDHLFRFGGEEFVLLMSGVRADGIRSVIENLRQTLREQLYSPGGSVTASFGIALLEEGEDWRSWLSRADEALYAAKDAGRDCVVVASSE